MNLGLVLDTSALLAHVRLERLSAGELIGEVADNGDVTGIPALAALDALPQLKGSDRARLEQLLDGTSHATAMLPLMPEDLIEVERVTRLISAGLGTAQAITIANKYGVMLATTQPAALGVGVVIHEDDVCTLS